MPVAIDACIVDNEMDVEYGVLTDEALTELSELEDDWTGARWRFRVLIYVGSKSLNRSVAGCSKRTITRIRRNLEAFGDVSATRNGVRRPRSITQPMFEVLCEHLKEKTDSISGRDGSFPMRRI
ncbi:predicted protein [Histoplasma mississippiense (nom. inval.)]|uniref:predicted protein n=1 Tax=Ajellomyces capsulatus (strain NAm1 / WU24) TaxID=2059318 RepID=UPI000157CA75|nr:predicted protein [Histoplasma mississippiense (nom. inval.)]EDN09309.1 predicted protein [Histoplasma mississippiense (nom. inval.)]